MALMCFADKQSAGSSRCVARTLTARPHSDRTTQRYAHLIQDTLLRAFPELAKRKAGYQIDRVQKWLEPDDFKPMTTVGESVYEIRVKEPSGAFRVIYVAKFEKFVYVLHYFQKQTQRTPKKESTLLSVVSRN